MCLDPERIKASRIVNNVFPKARIKYNVTTQKDFKDTLDSVLRRRRRPRRHRRPARGPDRRGRRRPERDRRRLGGGRQRAGEAREQDHRRRLQPGRLGHPHRALPGQGEDRDPLPQGRHARALHRGAGELPRARSARASRSCATSTSPRSASRRTARSSSRSSARSTSSCAWRRSRSQGGVEDIVMRILAAGEPIPLDKLGLTPHNLPRLKAVIEKPYGLFFCCGPTGSGKTTTLHSVLRYLNTPDTKIWTAEDPVEITQKGLRQVQVNKKAGLDFADDDEGVPARRPGHHHGRRDARQGDDRRSASRPRSPATWCSPRCTRTPRRNRSCACSTWAWTRSTSPTRCSASSRSASPSACAEVQAAVHPGAGRDQARSCRSTARSC